MYKISGSCCAWMQRDADGNHPQIDICVELCGAPEIPCDPLHIVQQFSDSRILTG